MFRIEIKTLKNRDFENSSFDFVNWKYIKRNWISLFFSLSALSYRTGADAWILSSWERGRVCSGRGKWLAASGHLHHSLVLILYDVSPEHRFSFFSSLSACFWFNRGNEKRFSRFLLFYTKVMSLMVSLAWIGFNIVTLLSELLTMLLWFMIVWPPWSSRALFQ